MSKTESSFHRQELDIKSEKWSVVLIYENGHSENKEIISIETDCVIQLAEEGEWDSVLLLNVSNSLQKKTCLIKGIKGSSSLEKISKKNNSQSVKLEGDNLVLSIGSNLLSIDLNNFKVNWNFKPDFAEVFEFYDFQNDYLLRGELEIHRINKKGTVKWSYGGRDIWVNIEGKPEVQIEEKIIRLLDFNSDEYIIDFDGNTMSD